MSLVYRFENVVPIVAGIIIVAAKTRVLSPQAFMPNLVVFDDRTSFLCSKMAFEHFAERNSSGLWIVKKEDLVGHLSDPIIGG